LEELKKLSLKKAFKTLRTLGLTDTDAQIYVYLSKKGPREEKNLIDALNINKNQLLSSLRNLVTKGMVKTAPEQSVRYSAIPLEKIIDELTKHAKEQIRTLMESREILLSNWQSIIEKDSQNN
jgi:sugar-specific transcriptional regulator TrmB